MNSSSVLLNLPLLVLFSCLLWWFVLPKSNQTKRTVPQVFLVILLITTIVPLGGFLSAMVALAFDEHLMLAPFSWVERPIFAAKVILACGVVGGFFSYGVTQLIISQLKHKLPKS